VVDHFQIRTHRKPFTLMLILDKLNAKNIFIHNSRTIYREVGNINLIKMKNPINSLVILSISALTVLFSCSKSDQNPPITTTYKLTLKATIPSSGNTTFTSISYKKEDGTTATLTNTTSSFTEIFNISNGYNIFLNVTGTNNSTTQPILSINYTVEKFENNISKGIICFASSVSVLGSAGSWIFNASNNSTFNGTTCQ
jgi:hypothetical protein